MATEQIDGIEFYVDVDTAGAVSSTKVIDSATKKMEGSFKKVDTQVTKTAKAVELSLLSQAKAAERTAIKQENAAEKLANKKAKEAERTARALDLAAKKEEDVARRLAERAAREANRAAAAKIDAANRAARATAIAQKKEAAAIQKGIAVRGRSFGQAGIQIQQFVGQVQGGQSALLAFSQQSADIGITAGAPLIGAIAGISASLVGLLLPSLLESESATSKLEKAMKAVNAVARDNDGVKEFTEEIAKLAKQSEASARLMIVAAEQASKEAGKAAAEGIGEQFNKSFDVTFFDKSFNALKSIAGTAGGTGYTISKEYRELGEQFGLTGSAAREAGTDVLISLREMENAVSAGVPDAGDKIIAFQEKLSELAKTSSGENRVKLLGFVNSISDYVKEAKKAAEISKFLNDALKNQNIDAPTKKSKELTSATEGLASSLNAQIIALEQGEEAAFRYATTQQLGLKVGEQIPENIDAQISALFRLKKAQEEASEAERDRARKVRDAAASGRSLASQASGVADSRGDPLTVLQQQKAKELEILRKAEEQGLQLHSDYALLRANIDTDYAEKERVLREQKYIAESKANELALSSIDALGVATTDTLSGLLSGTYSATEAMQQFASTILNSAIGALVDVGVQYAKNTVLSNVFKAAEVSGIAAVTTADLASKATITTAAVAQAGTVATAAAPAAALTSTYSFGTAAVVGGTALLATLALAKSAGGREHGGLVGGGNLYEVGEKNKPEILQSGSKQYMIPGNNGRVIPNDDIMSGGSGSTVQVVVNNLPGQSASVTETQSDDGRMRQIAIQVLGEQSASIGSKMNQNINKNHNVTNRQGGNRRN